MADSCGEDGAIRVLHLGKYYPPFFGGIENFMAALLPQLARRGCELLTIVHHHQSVWRGCWRSETTECLETGRVTGSLKITRMPILGRLLFTPLALLAPLQLAAAIRQHRPDILHIHMPNPTAFWLLLLPSARRLPWVLHWHADVIGSAASFWLRLAYALVVPLERRLLDRCQLVVCTSPPYARSSLPLRQFQGKVRIVPLGLAEDSGELKKEHSADFETDIWSDEKALRVLSIGRLTYYKGYSLLIDAVAGQEGVQLRIVGSGDQRANLQSQIDKGQVNDQISLLGSQPEESLRALLASCDCVVLSSIERTEAFGLVLLEAMQAGKAVIATSVAGSGMAWVVKEGETGLLAKPGDVGSLRGRIADLAAERANLAEMGEAGKQRFLKHFSIEVVADQTLGVYREALQLEQGSIKQS